LKRALEFLPKEGERTPDNLINHFEWGLRGPSRKQYLPEPKAEPKAEPEAITITTTKAPPKP